MSSDPFTEVRGALLTTSNTGGVSPIDAVEIDAIIDKTIQDVMYKTNKVRAMIPRKTMNGQLSYIWNVRVDWTTTTAKTAFQSSEGGTGTPYPSQKVQLYATALSLRSDWEVSRYFQAGSASYFNAIQDEIYSCTSDLAEKEEKQIILGTDTTGGDSNGFLGFKQLLNSYVTLSDTTTIYGIARASGKTYLDCGLVNAGSAALATSHLDSALTAQRKAGGQPGFFLMSYEKEDKLNQLLQAQQRFMGTLNLEGGFTVSTYKGVPIIASKYMSTAGASDTDTAIFLIAANNYEMRVLKEVSNHMLGVTRYDTEGGYLTVYEVLVTPRLNHNVLIYGLSAT